MKPYPLTNETTRQQIFDIVWKHFITDRNPLSHDEKKCRYRSSDGRACAIGVFLDDDTADYFDSIKGSISRHADLNRDRNEVVRIIRNDSDFFFYLQLCHDTSYTLVEMEQELRSFTTRFDLKVPQ